MYPLNPNKLLSAAKTSICLIGVLHETLWHLFPDEVLAFTEENEEKLLAALSIALHPTTDPNSQHPTNLNDPHRA
jgi:hypothetical protein